MKLSIWIQINLTTSGCVFKGNVTLICLKKFLIIHDKCKDRPSNHKITPLNSLRKTVDNYFGQNDADMVIIKCF